MTGTVFLILCLLSSMLLSCQGQIKPPTDGTKLTFLPGTTGKIDWSLTVSPSEALVRTWNFNSSDGSRTGDLTRIIDDMDPGSKDISLIPRFEIEKPATLILMNVDETYNGMYTFSLFRKGATKLDTSEVTVYIAVTPLITVNCSNVTTVDQGDNFACECKGTDGNPPANVTWYKDNIQIGDTEREKAILSLSNVYKDDNGTYRCQAKSGIEEAKNETEIKLIVIQTSKIAVNCSNPTTVIQGDNFACECKGTDGNPPADVTWYKDNTQIVTGKEEAILSLSNVDKDDNGTYRCVANSDEKAKNETSFELIIIHPPKNVRLMLTRSGQSAAITCTAEARPKPTFKIFFNCDKLVQTGPTYTIPEMNSSYVGVYKCVAANMLGRRSAASKYLSLASPPTTTFPPRPSQTTTNDKSPDNKSSLDDTTSGTEWYIIVVTLVSGIIIGILLSYIAWCSHRRWFTNRKPKRNPDQQPTEADSTYQGLDLSKMNKEDNYQSLRGNVARINDVTNDDDSNYTELSKTRDDEDKYQSLT